MRFFTLDLLIKLATSFIATAFFSILFRIDRRHILRVAVSGAICYFFFYTATYFGGSLFTAAFVSTLIVAIYSEICARISHAPAVIFVLTGLIPIVPGGDAYYCMRYFIAGDSAMGVQKLMATVQVSLGIAGGIVCVAIIFGAVSDLLRKIKKKKT